ncbi:DUF4879 domain-containing protein [Sphingomonas sp. MA1305]|uniref:DUF4879 domain-containing protein n=1 Tax=Sphingomonas sp. MA1305 TaxID=2479204 RepID=UPI0018DF72B1|nr:DUF4879 domain-containing protein [Sphingomonas sp. MA1305]MBI0474511.1 DUF4879 domain-containing protein [Sphingomonas sp. MA1305]
MRILPLTLPLALIVCTAPVLGQAAPPLTGVVVASVASPAGLEQIQADQPATRRHHAPGPVTVVVHETGIGGSRVTLIDGEARQIPSSTKPLCGPQLAAGACGPGQPIAGLEVSYRLGRIAPGQTFTFRDRSAASAGAPIETQITIN